MSSSGLRFSFHSAFQAESDVSYSSVAQTLYTIQITELSNSNQPSRAYSCFEFQEIESVTNNVLLFSKVLN